MTIFAILTCLLATLSVAQAQPEPAYRGRVEAEGRPLAGAEVELLPAPGTVEIAIQLRTGEEPAPLARTRTGVDGRFALTPPDLRPARIRVRARGFADAEIAAPPALDDVELPPLSLPPEREIRVTVVDPRGEPLAGWVTLVPGGLVDLGACIDGLLPAPRCGWATPAVAARLDAEGSARLPAASGTRDGLLVDADGRPRVVELAGLDRGSRQVVVPPGEERRLRAVDPSGRPVAGAAVLVGSPLPLAVTGADGRATVWAEPGTALDVHLRTADAASGSGRLMPRAAEAEPDVEPEVEILLEPGRRIFGRALDRTSGAPLAGAVVAALTAARPAISGADGGWELTVVPGSGAEQVTGRARGYLPAVSPVAGREETIVSLTPSAAIQGRLVDRDGLAVSGAVVVAFRSVGRSSLTSLDRPADPLLGASRSDGGFRLDGAAPGASYRLETRLAGFRPARTAVTAGPTPVELTLEPGIRVRGRIVDLDEVPIAGARVSLRDPGLGSFGDDRPAFRPAEAATVSDVEGRFVVADQSPGLWDLAATAVGFARTLVRGIEVPEADEHDLGTVVLGPATVLDGIVVDEAGRAIAGAGVDMSLSQVVPGGRAQRTAASASTGDDGRFSFTELQPGEPVDLAVRAAGRAHRRLVGVTPPLPAPLQIETVAAARVAGRVVDDEGRPVASDWVAVFQTGRAGGSDTALTADDGSFEIEVDPGRLRLQAGFSDAVPAMLELEVAAGEERRDLVLTVHPSRATVVGRVRRADGSPVSGAQVAITQGGYSRGGLTGGDGSFRLGASPGPAQVSTASGSRPSDATVDLVVVAGENRVDLVLPPGSEGATVRGHVVAPDGSAVVGATVVMAGVAASTDVVGAFELSGILPGTRSAGVTAAGFPSLAVQDLEVPDAGLEDLVFTLEPGAVVRGRLLDLGVAELARATLTLSSDAGGRHPAVLRPDGSFRIEGVAPGPASLVASFQAGLRTSSQRIEVPPAPGELEVELDLRAGYGLDGVVTVDGQPVQGARVALVAPKGRRHEASTDWQGGFRLAGLERGPQTLTIDGLGEQRALHFERSVDPADEPTLAVELPWTTVEGRVLGPDGAPLAGVQVFAQLQLPRGGPFADALADAGGAFRLGPIGLGRWQLQVVGASDTGPVVLDLVGGEPVRDLELIVEKGGDG